MHLLLLNTYLISTKNLSLLLNIEYLKIVLHLIIRQENLRKLQSIANSKQVDRLLKIRQPKRPPPPLQAGDQVYVRKEQRRQKFDDRFTGPFVVQQPIAEQNVLIQTPRGVRRTHRARIKNPPHLTNFLHGSEYDQYFRRRGGGVQ